MVLVTVDDLFEILAEIGVERDRRISLPGFVQDLSNGPPAANYLAALPHLFQHGVKVAGEFGLGDAASSCS